MSQQHNDDLVVMGRLGRPIGLKGQVKLYPFSKDITQLIDYQPWYMKNNHDTWQVLDCTDVILRDKFLLVSIKGVTSKEAAQALTHNEIAVPRKALPVLPVGEYYWRDLIGLQVVNTAGCQFGFVTNLMETGANDVLIVELDDKKRLIPFLLDEFILSIDISNKMITVDWDEDF
jgi:16S rRNA processing protein RimM